jgi:hypothetical protein
MATNTIEIQGTLHADGTIVLDEKPNLPPGRVQVTVQPVARPGAGANAVIAVLERIHADQARRGYVPRTAEEIDAYLAEMRDDDERCRMIEQIQEECRQHREGRQPPEGQ